MTDRMIRLLIQAGLVLAVIVALPYKVFELDRYFVPKELVLHVAALIIALMLVARRRSLSFDLVDGLLALFLLWSVASAIFATNHWAAQRSVAISISGAIVFWGARSVAERGSYRPILVAAAIAAVCAAALSLAQEIAECSPLGLLSTRATMRAGLADRVKTATDHELIEQNRLRQTDDFREGVKSTTERRPANFLAG